MSKNNEGRLCDDNDKTVNMCKITINEIKNNLLRELVKFNSIDMKGRSSSEKYNIAIRT